MAKEEVTLRDKFTKWNVYRRVGKELKESIECRQAHNTLALFMEDGFHRAKKVDF